MKERLTGAIILVALIVVLVPELLTGPVKSAPPAVATSSEALPLRSITINLGEDAHTHAAPPPGEPAPPGPQAAPETQPATPSVTPASGQAAQPAPAEEPAAPPPPANPAPAPRPSPAPPKSSSAPAGGSAGGAYLVQLGSFASRANAEHLAQQVKSQGFSAQVSQSASGRHLYRVRVGPVRDHAAAAQLQSKLKAAGHSGAIVPK